jgi:hypothetical protein
MRQMLLTTMLSTIMKGMSTMTMKVTITAINTGRF